MTYRKYIWVLAPIIITSCSFDSTFFAVKKQNLNAQISDLNYKEIHVQSADNKEIYCLLFHPEIALSKTIFLLQGSGDNIASWSTYAKHFVKEGFQVFMMEYRGFGANTEKATHKTVLSDAESVLLYLANMEGVRGNSVIVIGQSYGGQIAINLTAKYPEKVTALVIEGTFTSFKEEVAYQVPLLLKPILKLITTSPYKSKDMIKHINDVPVLIIHSTEDETVPFRMGQELFANANSPKYFWKIKGRHNHGVEDYTEEYMSKIRMLTDSISSNDK